MANKNTRLHSQQCSSTLANSTALKQNEAEDFLQQLSPAWQLNSEEQTITYTYTFKNYYQTMAFVNVIAQIAHQQDHHPDLLVSYNHCTVTYSTHSIGGLSINDFICAAKINASQKL